MSQTIAAETWQTINAAFVKSLAPLTREEALLYFDGAVPRWEHSVSSSIPKRQAAETVISRLSARSPKQGGCSLQLIRGAGGEGKTTILLQVAAALAGTGFWKVLWRPSANLRFTLDLLAHQDDSTQWLVVADDAENLIVDVRQAAMKLSQKGTSNIHFLLAARDSDWRFFRGDQVGWASWLQRHSDIYLRNATEEDARRIVEAWRNCGTEAMGALEAEKDPGEQVRALVNAINDAAHSQSEGSLFGGLLRVRFGPAGLRSHVISLLERLRSMPIEHSSNKSNLFDALLYVAACHGVGIPGIDANVLADLVGVERGRVQNLVVRPLGEEAAAVQSAGHIMTRHSDVAQAVLVEAEASFDAVLSEILGRLVSQAVKTGKGGVRFHTFNDIAHLGPRLLDERDARFKLPKQLSKETCKAIAVAAARADAEVESDRLVPLVDLAKTYRASGDCAAAAEVFRENLASAAEKVDCVEVIRGFWYEWAVCEGTIGEDREYAAANVWLAGISLSDMLNPVELTDRNVKLICAGIAEAFRRMCDPMADTVLARAHRASAYLGKMVELDSETSSYFQKHHKSADNIRTGHPHNLETAIDWIRNGVLAAREELEDSFLLGLANPNELAFKLLETTLHGRRSGRSPKSFSKRQPWKKKRRY
ncbi:hypothetical protein [Prosthecobacter sp.]|uniref:P-loop NTPase n=1 Tax=Prosthecobacter sp. TaxID=1965333 RepID=UPI003783A0E2